MRNAIHGALILGLSVIVIILLKERKEGVKADGN